MERPILASLQSIAMQRSNLTGEQLEQAPPIHLFIDECQHYVTPSIETILTETRKYKLYLTLANQFLDQIENRRIKNAIKGNTALKITGRQTEPDTLAMIAKTTSTDPEAIRSLETGHYHIKAGELDSVQVEGKTDYLDSVNGMNPEQWEAVKSRQINDFYGSVQGDFSELFVVHTTVEHTIKRSTKSRKLN